MPCGADAADASHARVTRERWFEDAREFAIPVIDVAAVLLSKLGEHPRESEKAGGEILFDE